MSYLNGKVVLPDNLLIAIQEHIDGGYIYIPRKEDNKRAWGTNSQSKKYTFDRNQEILKKYLSGILVKHLAHEYYLSVKTIYGILSKMKIQQV